MTNPTTPFSWQMPTSTDLVTDLPADFATFGQAVATSMADLLGGTTGQILSKASNTDMDFTWVTNDVGDITAVTAGTGLSGGGTSGSVTLSIDTATTVDLTTAQTLTNKTLTSPALTTPTISTIDAKGDLLAGTADNTIGRRSIGANGTVLTADSAEATGMKWAAAAGASGFTLISKTSWSAASSHTVDNVFTSTYTNYMIVVENWIAGAYTNIPQIQLRYGTTTETAAGYYGSSFGTEFSSLTIVGQLTNAATAVDFYKYGGASTGTFLVFNIERVGTGTSLVPMWSGHGYTDTNSGNFKFGGTTSTARDFTGFLLKQSAGTSSGNVSVYGLAKA